VAYFFFDQGVDDVIGDFHVWEGAGDGTYATSRTYERIGSTM
jgi:hypothetical protein